MPYIQRNNNGVIISLKRTPDEYHSDYLAPTESEIVDFLSSSEKTHFAKETLSESDQEFTRVTEDLIHLLIKKNIILFTELPPAVQTKMAGREKLRSNLNEKTYNFLDNGDSI